MQKLRRRHFHPVRSGPKPIRRYNAPLITRDLRSFLDRDWVAVHDAKDAYWAEVARTRGPCESLRIADELRRQMLQLRPDWPSAEDRAADLETHLRLSERLRRGGNSRRR